MNKKLLLFAIAIVFSNALRAQIVINEVMSSNISTVMDSDNDYSDWIEIYNAGSSSVNINNYSLSDDPDTLAKWKFPSMSVSAGGYATVWCSGKNRRSSSSNLHTNFSLKANGEVIFLCNASGTIIDNVSTPLLASDYTWGRLPNGSANWTYLSRPTFKLSNNNTTAITGIITTTPAFSIPGGMYTASQNVVLSHPDPTYVIRYTLDGSDPTINSPVYSTPINVHNRAGEANYYSMIRTGYPNHSYLPDWFPPLGEVYKCNIIRARAFKTGYIPGPIQTYTYFIDPNIFSRYGNLPIVSVVSDPKNLFNDTTGIYVPGLTYQQTLDHGNYHNGWVRPANIEIYRPDGVMEFNGNFKIDIGGESSESSPQKALNVTATTDYGPDKIDYPVFENTKGDAKFIQKFDKIKLRAWGTDRRKGLLHDGFCNSFMTETNIDYAAYQVCVLFIDGEYWGLQEIRERNRSGQFYQSHYYVDKKNPGIDLLKGGGNSVEEGDAVHWDAMMSYINSHSMTNTANYEYVKTQMDVDNFMLYCMFSIYLSRGDWPDQNEAKWRPRIPGGKWKWIQWDMDNTVANDLTPWFDTFQQALVGNANYGPSPLLVKLIQNTEFKNKFINLFADYMNTVFIAQLAQARLDEKANELRPYIQEFKNRWQLNPTWETRIDSMNWFLDKRPRYVKEDILSNFSVTDTIHLTMNVSDTAMGNIKINTILLDYKTPRTTVSTYPWRGTYFKNVPVPMTAIPKPGYKFIYWLPSNDTNASISYNPTTDISLTAVFDIDSNYHPFVKPVINEAMTSNLSVITDNYNEFDDWIEIYNPGTDTIDLAGYYLSSNLVCRTRFKLAAGNDSTKIEPNGHLLIWMDDDTEQGILHASFKLGSSGDFVALIAPDGETLIDSITIGSIPQNQSYGRSSDASLQWIVFPNSTPHATNNPCAPPVALTITTIPVCSGDDLNLSVNAVGTVTGWNWSGPTGFTSTQQSTSRINVHSNQSGLYTVTATNNCGSSSASVNVIVGNPLTNAVATASSNTICTGHAVNLYGAVTGIADNWNWTGPNGFTSTLQNPSIFISHATQGGLYTVTASNACGSITSSVNINVNVSLDNATVTASASPVCTGQTLTLNGNVTGTVTTWSWIGPNGYTSAAHNPVINISSPSMAGTYTMTATNGCGSVTAFTSVSVNVSLSNVTATASATSICTGQTLSLHGNVTGTPTGWHWSGPNGFTSGSQDTTVNITQANQTGTYTVTATNNCGSITASKSITVFAGLTNINATSTANILCTGQSLHLTASVTGTATSWTWTGPNSFTSNVQNPNLNLTTINQSGGYTVTATNTCGSVTATTGVAVNQSLSALAITPSANTICTGQTLSLNSTISGNALLWNWTGPGGFTSTSQSPAISILQINQAGIYSVTASNSCGTASSSVNINVREALSSTIASTTTSSICTGNTLYLSGNTTGTTGTWNWHGPNGYSSTLQNPTINITNVNQSGNYTLIANNSCSTDTGIVNVTVSTAAPSAASVIASSNPVCMGTTLQLSANATGNVTDWNWAGPAGFIDFTQNPTILLDQGNMAGTYSVVASNGCGSSTASLHISLMIEPDNMSIQPNANPACIGSNLSLIGIAFGTVNTWNWAGPNGFQSSSQFPALNITDTSQAGLYTLTATNVCGSASTTMLLGINQPPLLLPLTQYGDFTMVQPVMSTDQVQWYYDNNSIGTNDDSLLCQGDGNYFCVITNADGCSSASDTINVLCSTTGINNILTHSDISIYPNPFTNSFTIKAMLPDDNYLLTISNSLGKIIIRKDFNIKSGLLSADFSMVDFASGVYFVSIQSTRINCVMKIVRE